MDVPYEDFSLWISPNPEGGWSVKARSPAGEDSAPLCLPTRLEGLLQPFSSPSRLTADDSDPALRSLRPFVVDAKPLRVHEAGDLLFRTLFPGAVRQLYDRSCGAQGRRGLRIRLHFDPDVATVAELSNLPWEILYRAETKDFLGLNRLSPMVRYLEVPRPLGPLAGKLPLRILAVAASPSEAPRLNLDRERTLIEQAWTEKDTAAVEFLEHARADQLQEALRNDSGRVTIVHFMGHGTFDPETGRGCLLLEGDDGAPALMPGEVLANLLKAQLPHLVVLNACQSAQTGGGRGEGFFAGVASALVLGGVPAVIAMRAPIADQAAIAFSKSLYRDLAAGVPIDAAVAEGRLAIYRQAPESLAWATPVLFMRVPDGRLLIPVVPPQPEARKEGSPPPERSARSGHLRIGTIVTKRMELDVPEIEADRIEADDVSAGDLGNRRGADS